MVLEKMSRPPAQLDFDFYTSAPSLRASRSGRSRAARSAAQIGSAAQSRSDGRIPHLSHAEPPHRRVAGTVWLAVVLAALAALGHHLLDFSTLSQSDLVHAAPTLKAQVACALIHAVFWSVMLSWVFPVFFGPLVRIAGVFSNDNFMLMTKHTLRKVFMIDTGNDRALLFSFAVLFQGVIVQHGIGGALCIPSVFGLTDDKYSWGISPSLATTLAVQGALCEVGWERQDTLLRVFQLLFGGDLGRKFNPPAFLVLLALHHTAAQLFVTSSQTISHSTDPTCVTTRASSCCRAVRRWPSRCSKSAICSTSRRAAASSS